MRRAYLHGFSAHAHEGPRTLAACMAHAALGMPAEFVRQPVAGSCVAGHCWSCPFPTCRWSACEGVVFRCASCICLCRIACPAPYQRSSMALIVLPSGVAVPDAVRRGPCGAAAGGGRAVGRGAGAVELAAVRRQAPGKTRRTPGTGRPRLMPALNNTTIGISQIVLNTALAHVDEMHGAAFSASGWIGNPPG